MISMIKTLPLSFEEQMFGAKTIVLTIMNMVLLKDLIVTGVIGALLSGYLMFRAAKKNKQKNPHLRFLSIIFFFFSAATLFATLLAALNAFYPVKLALDLTSALTQVTQAIAMIISDPKNWWRFALMIVPSIFLPQVGINIARGQPWHYNSIGRTFANMYAGLGFTVASVFALLATGKSQKKIQKEQEQFKMKGSGKE